MFLRDSLPTQRQVSNANTYRRSGTWGIANFTLAEIKQAMKQMKLGKAFDTERICAEMLTVDCLALHNIILEVFNDILNAGDDVPEA